MIELHTSTCMIQVDQTKFDVYCSSLQCDEIWQVLQEWRCINSILVGWKLPFHNISKWNSRFFFIPDYQQSTSERILKYLYYYKQIAWVSHKFPMEVNVIFLFASSHQNSWKNNRAHGTSYDRSFQSVIFCVVTVTLFLPMQDNHRTYQFSGATVKFQRSLRPQNNDYQMQQNIQ